MTESTDKHSDMAGRRAFHIQFIRSEEGRIFLIGSMMLIAWVIFIGAMARLEHPLWDDVFLLSVYHMIAGKGVSILHGTQSGLKPWAIVMLATYADIMALFIVYPILIFSYRHFLEVSIIKRHMKRVFESAERGMNRFGKFKIAGVFIFTWIPLWMTGVIVGAVLGYLMGLKTWVNMVTVSLATLCAVTAWVVFYDQLFELFGWIREGISAPLVLLLIVTLAVHRYYRRQAQLKAVRNGNGA